MAILPSAPDYASAAALAITSPNGVEAAAALDAPRDLPVYAVGDATAAAARAAGFHDVRSAAGDGAALARLIHGDRPGGAVLHLSGRRAGFDLVGALTGCGLTARRAIVYDTPPAPPWGPEIWDALPDAIALVHSPAGAERFLGRIAETGLSPAGLRAAAISEAAGSALRRAGLKRVEIADQPDEPSLFTALGRLAGRG